MMRPANWPNRLHEASFVSSTALQRYSISSLDATVKLLAHRAKLGGDPAVLVGD